MQINNININTYGAKVQKKTFTNAPRTAQVDWLEGGVNPSVIPNDKEGKKLEIKILFSGANRNEVQKNISRFMVQAPQPIIKFRNLDNYYKCYLQSTSQEETEIDEWTFVTLSYIAIEETSQKTVTLDRTSSISINNAGTDITPVILEITPYNAIGSLTLTGLTEDIITITNLEGSKTLIIDSGAGKATINNVNAMDKVDLWEFPILKTGSNKLMVNNTNVKIILKYKERFI